MGLIRWLVGKFSGDIVPMNGDGLAELIDEYASDVCVREMAFWSAVNLVSSAVGKCEIKTYRDGKEAKGPEYYLWNVQPNRNQNSSGFMRKLIAQLYRNNEALVIENDGQLFVADSFTRTPYALYDDTFTQVTIGDFVFNKTFYGSDVLYWQLAAQDMREAVNRLYASYAKLLGYSMRAYQRSRGTKGIFEYESLPVGTQEREAFDKLVGERFSKWLSSDTAALPLGKGQKFTELQHKTYSQESTRDIRAQIDDISDFTARAFGIPPVLMRGDVAAASDAMGRFLTFCIDPLADMLQEEINRKRYGRDAFLAGNYVTVDTKQINHVDLLNASSGIDKLISSGAFSVNDVLKMLGLPEIGEPWADKHHMTKNYAPLDQEAQAGEGGEK